MAFLKLKCRVQVVTSANRNVGNGVIISGGTSFQFEEVEEIETNESTDSFTDFATVTLPQSIKFNYASLTGEALRVSPALVFGRGDYIKIETWYEVPQINTVNPAKAQETNSRADYKATFTGYISDIQTKPKIVIECENEMFALKGNNRLFPDDFLEGRKIKGEVIPAKPIASVSRIESANSQGKVNVISALTYNATLGQVTAYDTKTTDLDQILKVYLFSTYLPVISSQFTSNSVKRSTIKLPGYKTEGAKSLVEIFDDLKEYAGIYAYFRNGTLYIGPESWPEFQQTRVFAFRQNIINGDNLVFQNATDVKYRLEIVNVKENKQEPLKNGSVDYFGDVDGISRKFFVYNFDTKQKDAQEQLQKLADEELAKWKYTGYSGSFVTFGAPVVYKGDLVQLYDPDAPERGGEADAKYLVRAVDREFDATTAQYRQKITLSRRVEE